jgi:hypothetical protein
MNDALPTAFGDELWVGIFDFPGRVFATGC